MGLKGTSDLVVSIFAEVHPLQKNDYLIGCLIALEAKATKGSIYDRVCASKALCSSEFVVQRTQARRM
jgi:hypothetical protein